MVRTRAALMSLDASGTLAKTLVHSSCRGKTYTRRHVVPSDPKTAKQMAARALMRWLCRNWAAVTAPQRATWTPLAAELNLPNYQAYIKHNTLRWAHFAGPTNAYPATEVMGDWGWDAISAIGEVRQIKITSMLYPEANTLAIAIHRSSEGQTPTQNDLVAIITATGLETVVWSDTNVIPGVEYYYRPVILDATGHVEIPEDWSSGIALP